MPSSGLPIENLSVEGVSDEDDQLNRGYIVRCAKVAMEQGMFLEWLESFIGAWKEERNPIVAANAGMIEWDLE
jgi:hypothetical protein